MGGNEDMTNEGTDIKARANFRLLQLTGWHINFSVFFLFSLREKWIFICDSAH